MHNRPCIRRPPVRAERPREKASVRRTWAKSWTSANTEPAFSSGDTTTTTSTASLWRRSGQASAGVKYFSDKPDGAAAALKRAREHRRRLVDQLPWPARIKRKYVLNRTGVIGVSRIKERARSGTWFVRSSPCGRRGMERSEGRVSPWHDLAKRRTAPGNGAGAAPILCQGPNSVRTELYAARCSRNRRISLGNQKPNAARSAPPRALREIACPEPVEGSGQANGR